MMNPSNEAAGVNMPMVGSSYALNEIELRHLVQSGLRDRRNGRILPEKRPRTDPRP